MTEFQPQNDEGGKNYTDKDYYKNYSLNFRETEKMKIGSEDKHVPLQIQVLDSNDDDEVYQTKESKKKGQKAQLMQYNVNDGFEFYYNDKN